MRRLFARNLWLFYFFGSKSRAAFSGFMVLLLVLNTVFMCIEGWSWGYLVIPVVVALYVAGSRRSSAWKWTDEEWQWWRLTDLGIWQRE